MIRALPFLITIIFVAVDTDDRFHLFYVSFLLCRNEAIGVSAFAVNG